MSKQEDTSHSGFLGSLKSGAEHLKAGAGSAGSALLAPVKATGSLLNPFGKGQPEKEADAGVNVPLDEIDEEEDNSDMSNVALSDNEDDKSTGKSKTSSRGQETVFGTIKNTTESAGAVIIGSGAAIIGGVKTVTSKLNPIGGHASGPAKSAEPVMDDRQVEEAFSKIEIDEEPEPEPVHKPKAGIFGQLKATVGMGGDQEEEEAPKGSFLDSVKTKTGFAPKDDGIAHNSAPKEGFIGHLKGATNIINPFAGSASAPATKTETRPAPLTTSHSERAPAPNRFTRDHSRTSVTSSSKTSTNSPTGTGGGLFDSLTGKSSAPPPRAKPEPPKESFMDSVLDSVLGKPAPPPKEPTMFEKMTGQGSASKKSDGFW